MRYYLGWKPLRARRKAVRTMLNSRQENARLIHSSHLCSANSPVSIILPTRRRGETRQRAHKKIGTLKNDTQSASRMFRWKPSTTGLDPKLEATSVKKRQKISPTPRIWTRFSGVSGCHGFRERFSSTDGQSNRPKPTPARRSKAAGKSTLKNIFRSQLVEAFALRVKNFELAEERGLRFDLRAVADHNDLHVR